MHFAPRGSPRGRDSFPRWRQDSPEALIRLLRRSSRGAPQAGPANAGWRGGHARVPLCSRGAGTHHGPRTRSGVPPRHTPPLPLPCPPDGAPISAGASHLPRSRAVPPSRPCRWSARRGCVWRRGTACPPAYPCRGQPPATITGGASIAAVPVVCTPRLRVASGNGLPAGLSLSGASHLPRSRAVPPSRPCRWSAHCGCVWRRGPARPSIPAGAGRRFPMSPRPVSVSASPLGVWGPRQQKRRPTLAGRTPFHGSLNPCALYFSRVMRWT